MTKPNSQYLLDNLNCIKKIEKPWGYEIWWAVTDKYVGKLLYVKKGHSLSYQYHLIKDESMYLISGKLDVELNSDGNDAEKFPEKFPEKFTEKFTLNPGDSVRIKPLVKHRMTALEDSEIFEVSTPELDDIVRLDDKYGRV